MRKTNLTKHNVTAAVVAAFLSGNAILGMEAFDAVEAVDGGAAVATGVDLERLVDLLTPKVKTTASDTSKKFSIQGKLQQIMPDFKDFSYADWGNVCNLLASVKLGDLEPEFKKTAKIYSEVRELFSAKVTVLESKLARAEEISQEKKAEIQALIEKNTTLSARVVELETSEARITKSAYDWQVYGQRMADEKSKVETQIETLQQEIAAITAALSARVEGEERRVATAEEIVVALRGEVERLRIEKDDEITALNTRLQRFNDFQRDESASMATGSVASGVAKPILELSQVEKDLESIEGLQYLLRVSESATGSKDKEKYRLLTDVANSLIIVLNRRIEEFERGLAKHKMDLAQITKQNQTWGASLRYIGQSVVGLFSAYVSAESAVKVREGISLADVQRKYIEKKRRALELNDFNEALINELFPESAVKSKTPSGAGGAAGAAVEKP